MLIGRRPRVRHSVRKIQRLSVLVFVFGWVAVGCRRERSTAPVRPPEPPSFRIAGTVSKSDNRDHSGILVFCAGTSYLAYTDSRGSYTMTGVPPGKYQVQCQHSDYQSATIGEAALAEGIADSTMPFLMPAKTLEPKFSPAQQAERILCSVMGVVRLKDRATADGVVVRAVGTDFRTVTDSNGSYQLLRLDPGQYTIVLDKTGYREQRMPVRLVSGDLVFPDPIVLEPLVERTTGRTLSGNVILLGPQGELVNDYAGVVVYIEGTTRMTLPGSGGLFRFDDLAPGRVAAVAVAPGFIGRDRTEVDLTEAVGSSITLTLRSMEEATSAPGALVGRVLKDDPQDALAGTMVGLVETGATVMTDAKGNYSFANLPSGTYSILAQAEGYLQGKLEQVEVDEGETAQATDLTLEKRRDYPRVLFTSPANGERNIIVRNVIPVTIRFTKKMQAESLRAALSIEPKVGYRLYAGREHPLSDYDRLYMELLGFGTDSPVRFDATYTITVSQEASDDENLHLQQPHRFSFRTGRASIIGTRPTDGAAEVVLDPAMIRLGIFCNARLDPKTVTAEKFRIRPALNNLPQIAVINSPASGWSEISLGANWDRGVRYTVMVGSGIRTLDGSSLSNLPYTFSFTTSAGRPLEFTPGAKGRK